jgi:hypothetical protein
MRPVSKKPKTTIKQNPKETNTAWKKGFVSSEIKEQNCKLAINISHLFLNYFIKQ